MVASWTQPDESWRGHVAVCEVGLQGKGGRRFLARSDHAWNELSAAVVWTQLSNPDPSIHLDAQGPYYPDFAQSDIAITRTALPPKMTIHLATLNPRLVGSPYLSCSRRS